MHHTTLQGNTITPNPILSRVYGKPAPILAPRQNTPDPLSLKLHGRRTPPPRDGATYGKRASRLLAVAVPYISIL